MSELRATCLNPDDGPPWRILLEKRQGDLVLDSETFTHVETDFQEKMQAAIVKITNRALAK